MKKIFNLANFASFVRLPLALLIIYAPSLMMQYVYFAIAALSDLADGFIARKLKETSKLGAILDPIFDRVFLIIVFIFFFTQLELPLIYILLFFTRDAVTITFSTLQAAFKFKKKIDIKARLVGKIVTGLQFATLLIMMAGNLALIKIGMYVTFIFSIIAIADYVKYWESK